MIITAIKQAVRDQERVNIYADGKFAIAIDKSTLIDANLHQGKQITEEQLKQILLQDCFRFLARKAVEIWYRKPHSQTELRQKLNKLLIKRAGIEQIPATELNRCLQETLDNLQTKGYSDNEYAQWFAQQRAQQQKYGKQRVYSELLSKKVSPHLAKQAVDTHFQDDVETKTRI
jgi:regulatory protein